MPLRNYGALKGEVTGFDPPEPGDDTPHLHVRIRAAGRSFRAAVNVKSRQRPSELVFFQAEGFAHPHLARYAALPAGFTPLAAAADSGALDYIRANLFPFAEVVALPHDAPGRDDDLTDRLGLHLRRAIMLSAETDIYIFGEPFPDGIHDVHMNQGSIGGFAQSNGVWQDGALLLHDRRASSWVALFLAFQSQAIHTDDATGHARQGSATFEDLVRGVAPPVPVPPGAAPAPADGVIRIVAALVNPVGAEDQGGGETVTLINTRETDIDLRGWSLTASANARMTLPEATLKAGEAMRIAASQSFRLSNQGGIISLLDPAGAKVHGVAYTRADAAPEGRTIVFPH